VDQFLIYQSEDGQSKLDVRLEGEAICLARSNWPNCKARAKRR